MYPRLEHFWRLSGTLPGACFVILLLITACGRVPPQQFTSTPLPVLTREGTPSPVETAVQWGRTPSPTVARTSTPPSTFEVCAPLRGMTRQELFAAVSNPFNPPPIGSDNPHQGVDLAVVRDDIALSGEEVFTVMQGVVAAVISDRFPYGNALMIETPLEALPADLLEGLHLPTPMPTLGAPPSLTCPPLPGHAVNEGVGRSLYLLYAHLLEAPRASLGERFACGVSIGQIGQSGNALNPHLHLELRIAPSGIRFESIAHYDTRASSIEMANYCLWRVSGLFQPIDVMPLLALLP